MKKSYRHIKNSIPLPTTLVVCGLRLRAECHQERILPSLPPGHQGSRKQAPRRGSRIYDCLSELSQASTPGSNRRPLATHERSDATLPAVTRVPDDSASGPVSPEVSGLTGTGSCKTNLGNDPSR